MHPDGRVGTGVAERTGHREEDVGVPAVVVVGQRRGLLTVDGDHALAHEAAVGVQEALDAGVAHLTVRPGPRLGGGGEHEREVVHPRLTALEHVCGHVRHLLPPAAP